MVLTKARLLKHDFPVHGPSPRNSRHTRERERERQREIHSEIEREREIDSRVENPSTSYRIGKPRSSKKKTSIQKIKIP